MRVSLARSSDMPAHCLHTALIVSPRPSILCENDKLRTSCVVLSRTLLSAHRQVPRLLATFPKGLQLISHELISTIEDRTRSGRDGYFPRRGLATNPNTVSPLRVPLRTVPVTRHQCNPTGRRP